jgi:hypothetical protein
VSAGRLYLDELDERAADQGYLLAGAGKARDLMIVVG